MEPFAIALPHWAGLPHHPLIASLPRKVGARQSRVEGICALVLRERESGCSAITVCKCNGGFWAWVDGTTMHHDFGISYAAPSARNRHRIQVGGECGPTKPQQSTTGQGHQPATVVAATGSNLGPPQPVLHKNITHHTDPRAMPRRFTCGCCSILDHRGRDGLEQPEAFLAAPGPVQCTTLMAPPLQPWLNRSRPSVFCTYMVPFDPIRVRLGPKLEISHIWDGPNCDSKGTSPPCHPPLLVLSTPQNGPNTPLDFVFARRVPV